MRIALGTFACTGITTQMGVDLPTGVKVALLHYTGKLRSGREPIGVPPFHRNGAAEETKVDVDLSVDAETEALLRQEAARQGTSVNQLAVHSVLIYLAELDFLGAPPAVNDGSASSSV